MSSLTLYNNLEDLEENFRERIPTSICPWDESPLGGLIPGLVTDIFGPSGIGKTQMVHQIAAQFHLSIPEQIVFVIDTKKTFRMGRLTNMLSVLKSDRSDIEEGRDTTEVDNLLVQYPENFLSLITVVKYLLKSAIKGGGRKTNLSVLLVDSVIPEILRLNPTFFRLSEGKRALKSYYQFLASLADILKIPVVVTNVVYSVPISSSKELNTAREFQGKFLRPYAPVAVELSRSEADYQASVSLWEDFLGTFQYEIGEIIS